MQRIGTDSGLFSNGDPGSGTKGTLVTAEWLNAMQEELAYIVEGLGVELDDGDTTQILSALLAKFPAATDFQNHVAEGTIHIFAGMEVNLSYVPSAGEMASLRMLERNGASLLRADYPALYAKIGVMYGAVDGTHFNLPDDRGLFARTWDHGAGVDPGAANTRGGILTAGSPVITSVDTAQLEVGMLVVGTGVPAGATVVSIDSYESVTISSNATVTNSPSLLFTNRTARGDGAVGDNVGTVQNDGYGAHDHGIGGEVLGGTDGTGYDARVNGAGYTYDTSPAGGNETRAKNRYKWGGIFY